MSDITFIVANKRSNSSVEGVAGSKYFTDCTVDIQHEFANSVTEHPVETGESFSDHVQRRNNRFTVNGVFSEIPLRGYQGDTLPVQERVAAAYEFLKRLRDERLKFTLVSKYESYPDCVVENLSIPTTAENSSSLFFTLSVVQIRTAKTTLVNIVQVDNVREDKKDDASKTGNDGKKNTDGKGNTLLLDFAKYSYESGATLPFGLADRIPADQRKEIEERLKKVQEALEKP